MSSQSSSRRRRRGEGRGEGGEWREKVSASEFDVGVDGAKSEIKVERMWMGTIGRCTSSYASTSEIIRVGLRAEMLGKAFIFAAASCTLRSTNVCHDSSLSHLYVTHSLCRLS